MCVKAAKHQIYGHNLPETVMGGGLDILGGRGGVFASTVGGVLISIIGTHLVSGEQRSCAQSFRCFAQIHPISHWFVFESAKQVLERSHLTAFAKPRH